MNPNQQLIHTFYTAFQERDYAGMIACYHDDVRFSDPVFTDLRGAQAKAMWHMLCERGQDLQVAFRDVTANERTGQAHYTFDLWRWTRMALGPMGVLLGWSPLVQGRVRGTAVSSLHKFIVKHPEYQ